MPGRPTTDSFGSRCGKNRFWRALVFWALALSAAAAPAGDVPSSSASAKHKRKRWSASSTSYCLRGLMANGHHVHRGAAASNRHPLGTLIRLERPVYGRRVWAIRDRADGRTDLDLWSSSCSRALTYGRRLVHYRIVNHR